MKVAGILQPGTILNYVVESKHVRAGLIVVQTIEERDALVNSGSQALVHGTPVYVAGTSKTYRYDESSKTFSVEPTIVQDKNGVLCIKGENGKIEKVKVEVSVDDLAPELKEEIENLPSMESVEELIANKLINYVTLASFEKTIQELRSEFTTKLDNKQDKLIAGNNITIEDNVISAVYKDVENIKFATKSEFPYQGKEDVLYVAKDEKKIYLWDASTTDYTPIGGDSSTIDITIIDGGDANPNLNI